MGINPQAMGINPQAIPCNVQLVKRARLESRSKNVHESFLFDDKAWHMLSVTACCSECSVFGVDKALQKQPCSV